MSAVPIPKPRALQENKRPIPLPRRNIQKQETVDEPPPDSQNTFSRRMRTLSSTSKQITDEISEKVQETKKAVIESTRQSVRRITRKFSTPNVDHNIDVVADEIQNVDATLNNSDIFDSIRFQSPLTIEREMQNDAEPIYGNTNHENGSDSDESISLPPPTHPPPPLPDESMYDSPQSIAGTLTRPPITPRVKYEAIFPVYPVFSTTHPENSTPLFSLNPEILHTGFPNKPDNSDNRAFFCTNPEDSKIAETRPLKFSANPENHKLSGTDSVNSKNVETRAGNSANSDNNIPPKSIPPRPLKSPQNNENSNIPETENHRLPEINPIHSKNSEIRRSNSDNTKPPETKPPRPSKLPQNVENSKNPETRVNSEPRPAHAENYKPPIMATSTENRLTSDSTANMQRSGSWAFYDPVTLNEVTYENTEIDSCLRSGNRLSDSGSSTYSELNTCYENYILELHRKNDNTKSETKPVRPPRPTKSTIIEFDPLLGQPQSAADIAMLEHLLQSDLYGNTTFDTNYDQWSISSDMEEVDYINPPTPPTRIDSLAEEPKTSPVAAPEEKTKTNWFTTPEKDATPETKKSNWMKQLNDVLKKVPESARHIRGALQKERYLDRPSLNDRVTGPHKGILFKINRKSVEDLFGEFSYRWCILGNGALTFYSDTGCDSIKECFSFDSILSVQNMDKKMKLETELFCFEVSVSSKTGRGGHMFGCPTESDCKQWMQKIAEALTNRFPLNVVSNFKRMGWAYLREGVSGIWTGAWLLISARTLYYAKDKSVMCTIDLRKARCIQLQESDPESPKTTDKGPNLLVDTQEGTVYARMWTARETKLWSVVLEAEGHRNGRELEDQQLTKDNVPVIVEKCINFIYAHGSMSEGIYRRSGSQSTISEILGLFHQNAWSVTLTVDNCNEHDIANVLKRFLRSLPDPILTAKSSKQLCQIADSFQNASEKVKLYKSVLETFSTVFYNTLHRLLGHLHFIQSQSTKNRMSVDNLAAILGPTLVHHEATEGEWSPTESNLVVQLISMYRDLFPISTEELDKERMMLQVLERCHRGATTGQGPAHMKASGDLRVWIHLWEKNGETINVTIGPQKLAADVCMELSDKMKTPAYELQLEELVLNDCLRRPVHYSEKVLDVVLRWGYWDEADRKDNCLVLTTMAKYKQFEKTTDVPAVLSEELKFADNKLKTFKLFTFKFAQMKLCYFKDKLGTAKIQEWNIEDILWYFGHEHRHNPQTKWSLTFILRKIPPRRSKHIPFFGYTIGGADLTTRVNWVSAMIKAEYTNGLKPPLMNLGSSNG